MSSEEAKDLTYRTYLRLDELLKAQNPLSKCKNGKSVHDEHLFIAFHQVSELWFKEIIYDIESIIENLDKVGDGSVLLLITRRLSRVNLIFKLLIDQFSILETMTALDFLDFRIFLGTASGAQSAQFRMIETLLGLPYVSWSGLSTEEKEKLERYSESGQSLFQLIERWLGRTAGLNEDGFHFLSKYKDAVDRWIRKKLNLPATGVIENNTSYNKEMASFDFILKEENGDCAGKTENPKQRLSQKAFQGAMMIYLYRDEPCFHVPFQILTMLQDLDSHLMKWRHSHLLLVQRMIGNKAGTGGTTGHEHLKSTISDNNKVFGDLFNLSTYIIPSSYIPQLPEHMKKMLGLNLEHPQSNDQLSPALIDDSVINQSVDEVETAGSAV